MLKVNCANILKYTRIQTRTKKKEKKNLNLPLFSLPYLFQTCNHLKLQYVSLQINQNRMLSGLYLHTFLRLESHIHCNEMAKSIQGWLSHEGIDAGYSMCIGYVKYIQPMLFLSFFFFFLNQSHVYFPPLSLSVCVLTLSHSFSPSLSLCLAGLIECLNKLINHWHWWKTDRSGEVMFIKLPPICFFNPCSRLFAEYAHSFFLP